MVGDASKMVGEASKMVGGATKMVASPSKLQGDLAFMASCMHQDVIIFIKLIILVKSKPTLRSQGGFLVCL